MADATRGERNANPTNLVRNDIAWQGMAEEQDDPRFCVFKLPHWGIRAAALVVLSYYRRHGLGTVRKIISRWAPNNENDTEAYIADVAKRCGVDPDDDIDALDPAMLARLVTAIIWHENGRCIYSRAQIANAVDDALGRDETPLGEAHV